MKISTAEFDQLMQTIADGWNEGNARTPALAGGAREAADCFSEDAIYVEPPDKQLYRSRAELYEFFGGDNDMDLPMKMTWHHLAFSEEDQIGFGEYTFEMNGRYHGIVVVKIEAGLIKHWREYQYQTGLNWEEFTSQNPF
jgi:hypothetical protein